jgi:hypothetical protein
VDDSCRPLVFGRREVRPYAVQWGGSYVRLSAVTGRQDARYANIGRRAWHERAKLLVRRTGDRVQAAVDSRGDYASNNFFVVFPRAEHPLDLDGLCAVLNSRLMTGYFRAVEPRRGRAFAELKIKHLSAFPLPRPAQRDACEALNRLGARRRVIASPAADSAADALDRAIDAATLALFGLVDNDLHDLRDLPLGES